MKKKIIAGVLAISIIAVGVYFMFFNKKSINGQANSIREKLTTYHSEATMDMYNGEDTRSFAVIVCYKKEADGEKFRVSMFDKAINQEQIILRNENGVFVLTPALNQVHQFKGDWPLNSPKPYLYHSMLDVFKGSHKVKNLADGYQVTSKPNFRNAPNWINQEIVFTSQLKPLTLKITSESGDDQVRITFTKFETDVEFGANHFSLEANMEQARQEMTSVTGKLEDLPLYPVNADYPANLISQTVVSIEGDEYHVLSYQGAKSFTIIQKVAINHAEMTVQNILNGEIVDLFNATGFYASSTLNFTYNGIEYRISSAEMTIKELVEVANGMDIVV